MRQKDKAEKYIEKLLKQFNGVIQSSIVECEKSRYYNVNGHILRVSDHIGAQSSGNMSIIIQRFNGLNKQANQYILHAHKEGSISVVTYEQLKKIIYSFICCSSFVDMVMQKDDALKIDKHDAIINKNESILGFDKNNFTASQLGQIKNFIKQNKLN